MSENQCPHRWVWVEGDELVDSYYRCPDCGAFDEGNGAVYVPKVVEVIVPLTPCPYVKMEYRP